MAEADTGADSARRTSRPRSMPKRSEDCRKPIEVDSRPGVTARQAAGWSR